MIDSIAHPSELSAAGHPVLADGRTRKGWPTLQLVAACLALHLLAAAVVYRDLIRNLYDLFDASPRLLVLEHGLARVTALVAFLPPVVPAILVVAASVWVGGARRERDVARWLTLALVPLAFDSALRALGVGLAPPASNPGELFDLPVRFSPGPRMIAELLEAKPSAGLAYWLVICSAAAIGSVYCVARALHAAEQAALEPVERRRRRRNGDPIGALQSLVVASGAFAGIAFAGQLILPWAVQLFMRTFG